MTTLPQLDEWMSENKLSDDVCNKLKDREVTMEELLEFNEVELRSFCDDMEFNSVQKARLLKAVKLFKLTPNKQIEKEEEKKYNNDDEQKTVFISEKENEQFQTLCNYEEKVNKLIENINNSYKQLDIECINTINIINKYFDEFINILKQKQKHLLTNIDNISKYKSIGFHEQSLQSTKYFQHITKMKDDFEFFANDTSIHHRQRMIKLETMLNEIMNINIAMEPIYSPYIEFSNINIDKIYNYFNKLEISYCDKPSQPYININESQFENNIFNIEWNIDKIKEFESDITGFQIFYCKINHHKKTHIKYYDDLKYNKNFMINILFTLIKYFKFILIGLQKFLPVFLRKDNKGKIIEINENNNDIMELFDNIKSNEWIKSELIKPNKRKYKIKDLLYNEKYFIKIRSSNKNGWSKFSKVIVITTPPLKLTWKYNRKSHKHFNPLTDSRMLIESNKYGTTYRLFGDNIINKKRLQSIIGKNDYKIAIEFIVHKMSLTNFKTSIGFVSYPFNNNDKSLGDKTTDFCLSINFGNKNIQIKTNNSTTNYNLYQYPWHKTRHGDSFIFDIDLERNNYIDIYHNGIHLPTIFQQLHNQGKKIIIPKKFILAASIFNDKHNYNYNSYGYRKKKKYKKKKKHKYIIGDVEINYLDENDMTRFRMFLRIIWYVFIPWFIRENFKFIVFIIIILYYMTKYRYVLTWNTSIYNDDDDVVDMGLKTTL